VVDVAEAAERIGLIEPVGELPGQGDGPLVARDGLPVVTALVMGVAEAVPDGPLPVPFAQVPHLGEGAFAVADGLVVVAEHGVRETDVLERVRLPGAVARPAIQFEAMQGVAERLGGPLLPLRKPPEVAVNDGLAGMVTDHLEQP
jgi:hypothetical protein